jgi:hypothetical protein
VSADSAGVLSGRSGHDLPRRRPPFQPLGIHSAKITQAASGAAGGHDITLSNPAVAGISLHYTTFKQITDDIDDARVYGSIHFRFEQETGGRLGREVTTYITKHDLRK